MSKVPHLMDPMWKQVAASRRRETNRNSPEVLFLKMPRDKASLLLFHLKMAARKKTSPAMDEVISSLDTELELQAAACLFASLTLERARKELAALEEIEWKVKKPSIIQEYETALRLGLVGDPVVDWIARVGGPA